jgi:hypothetical protein
MFCRMRPRSLGPSFTKMGGSVMLEGNWLCVEEEEEELLDEAM